MRQRECGRWSMKARAVGSTTMECRSADLPPGFTLVSGKRGPRNKAKEYTVMFRRIGQDPFIDWHRTYTADQLVWVDDGKSWAVIAVREV